MNIEINMNVVMRKLLYTSITALLLLGALFSCTDEDYKLYNTSLTNKIYFDKDTFFFEYGPREDKEVDLEVPISLIGLANFDRDVEFKVSADVRNSTAKLGVHYNMDEIQVFMKDSVTAAIKLDFKRDNLVKDIQYKLYLNLEANDEYIPTNRTKCLVFFGDISIEQPEWWRPDRLGTYNQDKLILLSSISMKLKKNCPSCMTILNPNGENIWITNHIADIRIY